MQIKERGGVNKWQIIDYFYVISLPNDLYIWANEWVGDGYGVPEDLAEQIQKLFEIAQDNPDNQDGFCLLMESAADCPDATSDWDYDDKKRSQNLKKGEPKYVILGEEYFKKYNIVKKERSN